MICPELKWLTVFQVIAVVSVFIILISTLTFLMALFMEDEDSGSDDDDDEDEGILEEPSGLSLVLDTVDSLALAFFTLEYVVRLLCAPNLKKFVFDLMNLADLMAVLPFLLSIIVEELQVQ